MVGRDISERLARCRIRDPSPLGRAFESDGRFSSAYTGLNFRHEYTALLIIIQPPCGSCDSVDGPERRITNPDTVANLDSTGKSEPPKSTIRRFGHANFRIYSKKGEYRRALAADVRRGSRCNPGVTWPARP